MADSHTGGTVVMPMPRDQVRTARAAAHSEHAAPLWPDAPVPFFTRGTIVLSVIAGIGLLVMALRFALGLGAVTNLNTQYAWGIWIAIDVATGVALAAGGFTTAFVAHILHNDKYHAVVRPALLTAMLGYTFVALGVVVDLGRFYNIWHVLVPSMWQGNSALFEVGMCVCCYLTVLYIEFLPIVCERFIGRVNLPGVLKALNRPVDKLLRILETTLGKVMNIFIIMGVVLSCAHQSSLGTLMALVPSKVHPLWHTSILPLQFLLSAFAVGLAMVVFEGLLASRSFKRPFEMNVLSPLARIIPFLLTIYFAAKLIDLVTRDAYVHLFRFSLPAVMYWIEILVGVVVPWALLLSHRLRRKPAWLFAAAAMVVFGVALNRFNVFIISYTPVYPDGRYVPKITEVLLTAGFICLLVLIYRLCVFLFPILPAEEKGGHHA